MDICLQEGSLYKSDKDHIKRKGYITYMPQSIVYELFGIRGGLRLIRPSEEDIYIYIKSAPSYLDSNDKYLLFKCFSNESYIVLIDKQTDKYGITDCFVPIASESDLFI